MKTFFLVLTMIPAILAEHVPMGCVEIKNRDSNKFLISSNTHDSDRRHVTYRKFSEQWKISKLGSSYRIRHAKLNEELYESEQSWNGNYLFTWIPKSSVKTGGWQIYGSGTEGYFYIKNEHFGHCLYMKGYGNWIYAYDECQGPKYEWKIYNVDTCKN
uniref:Uncharacterized protein n=1 Tax=Culex quinquefasciatus TaxID=7176 RepID=A0A1S4KJP1_CULQU